MPTQQPNGWSSLAQRAQKSERTGGFSAGIEINSAGSSRKLKRANGAGSCSGVYRHFESLTLLLLGFLPSLLSVK